MSVRLVLTDDEALAAYRAVRHTLDTQLPSLKDEQSLHNVKEQLELRLPPNPPKEEGK